MDSRHYRQLLHPSTSAVWQTVDNDNNKIRATLSPVSTRSPISTTQCLETGSATLYTEEMDVA